MQPEAARQLRRTNRSARTSTAILTIHSSKMLCPSTFQPPFSPFVDFHWPVCSLWPETRPLFFQIEQEMMRHMQEMRHSLEFMERLHRRIFDEIDHTSPSAVFKPISFQLGKESDRFAVTLDTNDFSPEELSVKQVGSKLRVSGKSEKKQDDGKGSYSYRCQEFRQEFDLPDGVNPEAVTCSLNDGKLQIQAPKETSAGPKERVVPIAYTPAVNGPPAQGTESQSQTGPEDSSKNGDQSQ